MGSRVQTRLGWWAMIGLLALAVGCQPTARASRTAQPTRATVSRSPIIPPAIPTLPREDQPAPTPLPTPARPGGTPGSTGQSVIVTNTGGAGVYLRASKRLDDHIRPYADNTVLAVTGPSEDGDGKTWLPVRAPDGTQGWVPLEFTRPAAGTVAQGTASPPGTPAPGATSLPAIASDFPLPGIPGFNAPALVAQFQQQGYTCQGPQQFPDTLYWSCTRSLHGGAQTNALKIWGLRADHVQYVTGTVSQRADRANDAEAANFLGTVAGLRYNGQDGTRARQWVEQNVSRVGDAAAATLTISGVNFSLYGPATVRVLDVGPVEIGTGTTADDATAAGDGGAGGPVTVDSATPIIASGPGIPGLEATDVTRRYQGQGFECGEAEQRGEVLAWTCRKSTSNALQYEVVVQGPSPTQIEKVTGALILPVGMENDAVAGDFLGALAQIAYPDADPARARQWVVNTVPNVGPDLGADTTIGAVAFRLSGPPDTRTLEIRAAAR